MQLSLDQASTTLKHLGYQHLCWLSGTNSGWHNSVLAADPELTLYFTSPEELQLWVLGNQAKTNNKLCVGYCNYPSNSQTECRLFIFADFYYLDKGKLTTKQLSSDTTLPSLQALKALHNQRKAIETDQPFKLTEPFLASNTYEQYQTSFNRVKDYLAAGDCYQTNLSQHFKAQYKGSPLEAALALHSVSKAPYSAYIECKENKHILSASPEHFIRVEQQQISTSPIKGTRPRAHSTEADKEAIKELSNSSKDRAENLMIVDLLRNDLGKNCIAGSITTPSLFKIESHPNVHHLVSTVTGQLKADKSPWDAFASAFPGGSITGAPKKRAMEIINELELVDRDIYCGSIFCQYPDGVFDSSITIRTMLADNGTLHCWGGSGIVMDSKVEEEYQECLDKINLFTSTLEALNKNK